MLTCIVTVCALLIVLDVWHTWQARSAAIAESNASTTNLVGSLAQHAHDTLQATDAILLALRKSLEDAQTNTLYLAHLHQTIESQRIAVPTIQEVLALDERGNLIVNAPPVELGGVGISNQSVFRFHQDNPDRNVHVGRPVQAGSDGTWCITLSRRVEDDKGRFNGIVLATITIDAMRQFYGTLDVGKEGLIALDTIDGIVVARHPGTNGSVGPDISTSTIFRELLPLSPFGNWRLLSPVDGIEHIGSYRRVDGYPLVVVVGVGFSEVLTHWRSQGLYHLMITLCSVSLIAALGVRFVGRLRFQHRAELKLEMRERRYRLLAEHSTDLIIQLGPDLLHVYVSPASETLLLYRPSELIGRHPSQLAHPDDWPALASYLSTIAQAGQASPVSYRARRKNGADVWVEAASRILGDGRGYVVVIRDIGQRKEAETQLRQAQRMEAVGQLTAGVAHDFNNMLQAQLGALELLLDEVADRPKAVQFATMALAAGEHGAKLTHSLLSFSRQQVLEPEAVVIPVLLSRLERILSRTLGPRIQLQFDIEPELAPVFADTAQLEAALLNLALNARDAIPEGGTLSIQACNGSMVPDLPDNLGPGRHVLIAVSDDGTGMSPETMARACEPFFTTKGVGKGSGLGLSMVQGFARQSGGALRFRNAPLRGTRVELWLPEATVSGLADAPALTSLVRGSGTVLLVDDVPEVLTVMTEALFTAGFSVVPVSSGEDALKRLGQNRFDALVTDFAMAGIDGGELARHAQRAQPQIPIIILTGYAESDKLATVPSGVVIVRKPISGDVLVRRICELVETAALTQKSPETA